MQKMNVERDGQVFEVLIDDEDWEAVSKNSWSLQKQWRADKWMYYASRRDGVKRIKMHRFITNAPPTKQVDHINGNGLDNRRANLRLCDNRQNCQNRHNALGISQYKGVGYHYGKWRARIGVNGKRIHLGAYLTETEAALAYDAAARKYFGEFARCNFS